MTKEWTESSLWLSIVPKKSFVKEDILPWVKILEVIRRESGGIQRIRFVGLGLSLRDGFHSRSMYWPDNPQGKVQIHLLQTNSSSLLNLVPQVGRTGLSKEALLLELWTSTRSSFHQQDSSIEDKWLGLIPHLKGVTSVLLRFSVVIFKRLFKIF